MDGSIKPPKDRWDKHKDYRRHLSSLKCYKARLSDIVKDPSCINLLEDAVLRMNRLVVHTYQFLKTYCLHYYFQDNVIPNIDDKLISRIMRTLGYASRTTSNKEDTDKIMNKLSTFNDSIYSKMSGKLNLSYAGLTQMIGDQSKSIMTCYENHIQEHFADIVRSYVNIMSDKESLIKRYKKEFVLSQLRKVKDDILRGTNTTEQSFSELKIHFNKTILQDFTVSGSLEKMASSAQKLKLLTLMVRMSIDAENIKRSRQDPEDREKQIRVINCFPMRASIIPAYVEIDSLLIIRLLMSANKHLVAGVNVKATYEDHKWQQRHNIWNMFFKMNHSIFRKKGYTFNYRIATDGVGCTVYFIRSDLHREDKKVKVGHKHKPRDFNPDTYIDRITRDDWGEIVNRFKVSGDRAFVGIDPGKRDLIFCTNGNTRLVPNKRSTKVRRKTTTFHYSNGQRKHETRSKLFQRKMDREKDRIKRYGKTIKEIEATLGQINSSSCIWRNHVSYMKLKNAANRKIAQYYEQKKHRMCKWYVLLNKMRSEANMLNRFEKTFGTKKEVVILMGDWSENKPMRYQEPTMGKSIRKLFRDRGYPLFLVDEYNTSKRLYEQGSELAYFRKDKDGNNVHRVLGDPLIQEFTERSFTTESHPNSFFRGIMESTEVRPTIINRDLNGSLNIRSKGIHIFLGLGAPWYMDRSICRKVVKKTDNLDVPNVQLDIPDVTLQSKGNCLPKLSRAVKSQKVQKTARASRVRKTIRTPKIQQIEYSDESSESSDKEMKVIWTKKWIKPDIKWLVNGRENTPTIHLNIKGSVKRVFRDSHFSLGERREF